MDTQRTILNGIWLQPGEALKRSDILRVSGIGYERVGESESRVRYGVWLDRIGLLIPLHTQSEVIDNVPIYPLPNTTVWFSGLCNLRGNIIPIYDLESLFGFRKGVPEKHYLLILDKGEKAVGILTKVLPQPHLLGNNLIMLNRPPMPQSLEAHVSTAYIIDQQVWFDFNHESFFNAIGKAGGPSAI